MFENTYKKKQVDFDFDCAFLEYILLYYIDLDFECLEMFKKKVDGGLLTILSLYKMKKIVKSPPSI